MPRFSGWAVRTALIYLLFGFTAGGLMLAHRGMPFAGWVWRLLAAHVEWLLVGWAAQLALGVAYWILPRLPGGVRGREPLVWSAYALLNLGLLAVALSGLMNCVWCTLAGRTGELIGALLFAAAVWPRVRQVWKPTRSH